jgi:hypothetical protein
MFVFHRSILTLWCSVWFLRINDTHDVIIHDRCHVWINCWLLYLVSLPVFHRIYGFRLLLWFLPNIFLKQHLRTYYRVIQWKIHNSIFSNRYVKLWILTTSRKHVHLHVSSASWSLVISFFFNVIFHLCPVLYLDCH